MPPCPSDSTVGTLATGILAPAWVTSQIGPVFSVTSMRPSGRKAMRQGRLKVATCVIVNGRLASGACAPMLTWAFAPVAAKATSAAAFANFILDPRSLFWADGDRAHAAPSACAFRHQLKVQ